jgi:hypothetical protein
MSASMEQPAVPTAAVGVVSGEPSRDCVSVVTGVRKGRMAEGGGDSAVYVKERKRHGWMAVVLSMLS